MKASQIKRRFDGFFNTPFLWEESLVGLEMFQINELLTIDYPKIDSASHIRLGKLIEKFVFFEIGQDKSIQLIKSNIQVYQDKTTIGELDCLIKQLERNIHLEIVYKFYLYDPSISTELDRWVGPNRNDSLVLKLNKLKEKQLPLLYHSETTKLLRGLSLDNFIQRLYFKAQLFVPYNNAELSILSLNKDCVKGFYIRYNDLDNFCEYEFYIPSKLDWLVEPHSDVIWMSFQSYKTAISKVLASHKSPLCWGKSNSGNIQKFFIVWWE